MAWLSPLPRVYKAAVKVLVRPCSHQEAQLEKNLLPNSFELLAEFIPLRLCDRGCHPQRVNTCISQRLPTAPCQVGFLHTAAYFIKPASLSCSSWLRQSLR